jgi:DNA-binding PadR family transcriptional regulator
LRTKESLSEIKDRTMTDTLPDPTSHLPLTPAVFHILLALADGEKHGYAIMQEVEDTTAGQVSMGPGTLYGSIKRMLKAGLIAETDERPDPALDDSRRRYYELSGYGRRVLSAEVARLEHAVRLAEQKHVWGGAAS